VLALPIDAHLPAIVASLEAKRSLVLVAEPGAGKTTRVPRALLDAGFAKQGEILVLQPRRIAARMAARFVAKELGEDVGGTIGYQVRFEEAVSKRTRVRFVTEGILTRRLVQDPTLQGVCAVVLDEFHERHIHADVGLALLRKAQASTRPDLRIVVMSATLATEALAKFLDAPVINVPGRVFPVAVEHAEQESDARLEDRVTSALRRLLRDAAREPTGDVLVFLPGAAEIRRTQEACGGLLQQAGYELALLHGDLPPREQDRAVSKTERAKVILSTNIAETSLTIEGVRVVIDSGLARVAAHSPFSGLPTLVTAKVSRASAAQRAGRAGRLGPGRCLRLFTKHDHDTRAEHDKAEIARIDLADTMLAIAASGATIEPGDWLDAPPTQAWRAARELLEGLSGLDAQGALTPLGRRMASFPLHPRLARLLFECEARGVSESGSLLTAVLGERDVLRTARARFDDQRHDHETSQSDLLLRLSLIESAGQGADASRLRAHDLDPGAVASVWRVQERLVRMLAHDRDQASLTEDQRDEALLMATLAAFFDRVAKRRARGGAEVVFAGGGSATLSPTSVVREAEYVVVVDAAEKQGKTRGTVAHVVSAIEPEWLLELFPERVEDRTQLSWNDKTQRVEAAQTLSYRGLVLDSVHRTDVSGPEVEQALYEAARARGLAQLVDIDAVNALRERYAFAQSLDPTLPALPEDLVDAALRTACVGKQSLSELQSTPLIEHVHAQLPPQARSRMLALTPDHVELSHGRRLQVHYERGKPPWVQSRLQDFFGMKDGPRIGGKPVVIHLLAPNQRPVQVTSDLAGFWQRHYAEVRRELCRRYPRHSWPDDPQTAQPPPPQRPRR
jgi:ATP-dependent helicase HrpB